VKTAIVLTGTRFWPRLTFSAALLGPHIRFSRDTGILGLVTFFHHQMDPIVIARFLGTAWVGIYSVANRIAYLPMSMLSFPLQNALFTRMVMIREDRIATRDLILVATWITAAIVFPGMAVAAAASDAYFELFLSAKWLPAAPVFVALAPVIALQAILAICGTMLLAIGATGRRLRLAVEFTVLWLITLPLAALVSVQVIAWSYTILYFLFSIRRYPIYLEVVGATAREYFGNLLLPLLIALAAAALHFTVAQLIHVTPLQEVAISIGVLALAYALLAYLERKKIGPRLTIMRSVLSHRGVAPPASVEVEGADNPATGI
jgi:O-antigen/teichoic acid export membrane protein